MVSELCKHTWTLKDKTIEHIISWKIQAKAKPYNTGNKSCNLCLLEKNIIVRQPELCTLNKCNELVSSCHHRLKALLRNACNLQAEHALICYLSLSFKLLAAYVKKHKNLLMSESRAYETALLR